jgi:TolA-binding protein
MKTLLVTGFIVATSIAAMSPTANAQIVSSDAVMQAQESQYNKQKLIGLVSRDDVQQKLLSFGVQPQDALNRIQAMTDAEVAQLNQQLGEEKAGGIVGAVLTVLAFLAITDLIGVTDVYPFIEPINS